MTIQSNVAKVVASTLELAYGMKDVRAEGEAVTFTLSGERSCLIVEYDEPDPNPTRGSHYRAT